MQIIWAKSHFPVGRGNYHVQHEPCWYAVRKGSSAHWCGDHKQTTVWHIDKPQKSETGHSTQKPIEIECMKRPIENNSSPGQAVYDPFVGSGTTIIAAEMTGRCCHSIELNPTYIDVVVRRWVADEPAKLPFLNRQGRLSRELMAKRCPGQPIAAIVNDDTRTETKADASQARHRNRAARPDAKKRAKAGIGAAAGSA